MVTSKDVARAAGVSQSTVSYVMSGKRPISERTRELVENAMADLTYQPHAGARALAGRRTNIIAVVMPFYSESSARGLMAFVEEIALAARARDHDVLMVTADEGPTGLQRVAGRALCDAVVVMEVQTHDERVALARSLDLPTMFIGLPADPDGLHCIDFDFEEAARLLVAELAGTSSGTIAAIGWGPDHVERDINYVPRFAVAAQAEADRLGIGFTWCEPAAGAAGVEEVLDEVLAHSRPGILLAGTVQHGVNSLLRRGLRPGRDLDVVALAPHAEAEAQQVRLTAVSPQPRDVSRAAMAGLFDLLDSRSPEGSTRLVPAELVRRDSLRTGV